MAKREARLLTWWDLGKGSNAVGKLYYNGDKTLEALDAAAGAGARFIAESANDRVLLEFYNNAEDTRQGFLWIPPDFNKLEIRSELNSDTVILSGKTSASATVNLFFGDPDTGVTFNGKTAGVSPPTYTPTNVVTDRSYDANATTVAELADVLGTLIADLQANGLLA